MKSAHTKGLSGLMLLVALLLAACAGGAGEQDAATGEAGLSAEEELALAVETVTPGAADVPAGETEQPDAELDDDAAQDGADAAAPTQPAGPIEFVEPPSRWLTSGRVLGSPVFGEDGMQLGRVVDILFSEQGELGYVIIGAAALGDDTLVAIPWGAMQWRGPEGDLSPGGDEPAGDASPEATAVEMLEMPNPYIVFVYPTVDQLHDEMPVEERLFRENTVFAGEDILAAVGADAGGSAATREAAQNRLLRVSQFKAFDLGDFPLLNDQAESIGEVEQLILDLQQGTVEYLLVEVGGFMGVGQTSVAVPWEMVSVSLTAEEFVLLAPAEALREAPELDPDTWAANGPGDEAWNEPVDAYWAEL